MSRQELMNVLLNILDVKSGDVLKVEITDQLKSEVAIVLKASKTQTRKLKIKKGRGFFT